MKLKLRKYSRNNTTQRPKFQVNLLQSDQKREEFQITLKNKFQPLELLEQDIETHWNQIKEAFTTTCQEVLGKKDNKQKEWISQESLDKIDYRRKKKAAANEARTRTEKELAHAAYAEAHREVKRSIRKDKDNFINELAERAEKAAQNGHTRTLYQTTRILSGKRNIPEVPVKDAEGKTIFDNESQCKRWKEHFEDLLNRPPPANPPEILPARRDLPISCEVPDLEEIERAVNLLNLNKAAGPDAIPPEALKADVEATTGILHDLFVRVWNEEEFPMDWKEGHIVKLPKKGDLSNCNNYRGITLLSMPGKVFNRVLLERIKSTVDEQLRDQQAGFRKNRSCIDQIAALRIIIEQTVEWNASLIVNFIDFEKAFDSIDRSTLWKIMRHYGIPQKIVNLTEKIYAGTNCRVIHDGQLSDSFDIKTGVRQGCILSPFLFILAMDWLMKESTAGRRNGIQWTPWIQLDDLDFADDVSLLSHTQQQMQGKTRALDEISQSIGLHIHPQKSKLLQIKTNGDPITVRGRALEEVESFTYLGSVIDKKGGTTADIMARISKARVAFKSLDKVWRDRTVTAKTKCRLFTSNVKSVLLYGCETWSLTQSDIKKLQTFINGCLRKIIRIRWPDKIRNEDLWERTCQKPVEEDIGKRKWKWIGHTLRKEPSSTTRQVLQWNPQGQRKRGRPRTTWRRTVEELMRNAGHTWKDLSKMAQGRDEWKAFVRGLYPDKGEGQ